MTSHGAAMMMGCGYLPLPQLGHLPSCKLSPPFLTFRPGPRPQPHPIMLLASEVGKPLTNHTHTPFHKLLETTRPWPPQSPHALIHSKPQDSCGTVGCWKQGSQWARRQKLQESFPREQRPGGQGEELELESQVRNLSKHWTPT